MTAVRGTYAARSDARRLRKTLSRPELMLWEVLRARRLGAHFRRQHAAGPFIMDFYCASARLCIEVDGQQHDCSAADDRRRDAYLLRAFGVRTVRIAAADVVTNVEGVAAHIRAHLQAPSGVPCTPSPPGGGDG